MNLETVRIRIATPDDAAGVLAIYAPFVADTTVTFECAVPSEGDMRARIAHVLERYPYLVAEDEAGQVAGYAYASKFRPREAYAWAVETSIYLRNDARGSGLSKRLYATLERLLAAQGFTSMMACITIPNQASVSFHGKCGFEPVGSFSKCGYKHGAWLDVAWMEKHIAEHASEPAPPVPFSEFRFKAAEFGMG